MRYYKITAGQIHFSRRESSPRLPDLPGARIFRETQSNRVTAVTRVPSVRGFLIKSESTFSVRCYACAQFIRTHVRILS